jgi:pSer/pThr/pTyr-binding forkhead associated (FHA) protein
VSHHKEVACNVPIDAPITRRSFLGALGLAGLALAPGLASAGNDKRDSRPRYWLFDRAADRFYPLRPRVTTLGRGPDRDVVFDRKNLADQCISRNHCEIWVDEAGVCELHDTSRNGTWLNGQRVAGKAPLLLEDRIDIADRHSLVLVDDRERQAERSMRASEQSLEWAEAQGWLDTAYEPDWLNVGNLQLVGCLDEAWITADEAGCRGLGPKRTPRSWRSRPCACTREVVRSTPVRVR